MTSLTLVWRIAARPSTVFDALTTPAGMACWWGSDNGPVLLAETEACDQHKLIGFKPGWTAVAKQLAALAEAAVEAPTR